MFNFSGSYTAADGSRTEATMNAEGDCAAYLVAGIVMLVGIGAGYLMAKYVKQ